METEEERCRRGLVAAQRAYDDARAAYEAAERGDAAIEPFDALRAEWTQRAHQLLDAGKALRAARELKDNTLGPRAPPTQNR